MIQRAIYEKETKVKPEEPFYVNHMVLAPFAFLTPNETLSLIDFYRNLALLAMILSPIILGVAWLIWGLLLRYSQ